MVYKRIIGTRAEVWHGTAKKTSGGLTKMGLMMNKHGRIVSRSKHATAKREMRLVKHGYGTKRGKFGFVKIGTKGTKRRGSRKQRGGGGGLAYGMSGMSPASYNAKAPMGPAMPGMNGSGIDGQGITMYSGDSVQLAAGQAGGRRSRRSRGHRGGGVVYGNSGSSPAMYNAKAPMGPAMPGMNGSGIDGQGITMYSGDSLQLQAGQAGGRRRRSRGHRGGGVVYGNSGSSPAMYNAKAPMGPAMPGMNGSGIDGQGITMYSGDSLQLQAGQAGGRRRRHKRRGHRGGTAMPFPSQNPGAPLNMALGAS